MITLNSCPLNTYFLVKELWFYYEENLKFNNLGLFEGTIVLVKEKKDGNVVIEIDNQYLSLNKEEASNVNGDVIEKKLLKRKK